MMLEGGKEKGEVRKVNRGAWKRVGKGERKALVQKNEQNKENTIGSGLKTERSHEEDAEDQQMKE